MCRHFDTGLVGTLQHLCVATGSLQNGWKQNTLSILGLQPRDLAAMLLVNTVKIISKNYFLELLVFLTTNMAAKTSRANHQYYM